MRLVGAPLVDHPLAKIRNNNNNKGNKFTPTKGPVGAGDSLGSLFAKLEAHNKGQVPLCSASICET